VSYCRNLFSSAGEAPKNYKVARGTPNRNSKNLLKYGNVGDLFSSAPEAQPYKVATGQNYENAKKANVERQRTRELERLASQQANSGNLFEPLNPANGNPAQVLSKINAIPDSKSASTNNAKIRVQNIVEAIQAVRVFLQQVQTEINDGLLDYLNQRYSVDPRSLIGEMGAKHKPVLKYIVSLAGDLASFTEKIQRPIGIFPKSDIQVRIDILTSVIATLPEENRAELIEYMNSLYRVNQSGGRKRGKRNTRCGCGLKGGRRTRKATRKRSNS